MMKRTDKSGFTLLEVILAVVIFSMVIGAVYSTFRSGLRMYKIGTLEKQVFQESRLLHNFTQRDLRSSLPIEETFYDVPPFPKDTTDDIDYATDTSWMLDETVYSMAQYPFIGTSTSISMYGYAEVPLGKVKGLRQGIFHIDYIYEKNALYRKTHETTGDVNEDEDLVHRLLKCEINYGYSKEGKWYWVDKWDSRRDTYRQPKDDKDEELLADPDRSKTIRVYPDVLPDAVRVTLTLQQPDNPKSEGREFQWVCDIPAARPSVQQ